MNRLQTELNRLYLPNDRQSEGQDSATAAHHLINADGQVRAMVVEITQPTGWDGVAALWQGVQNELDLPAPAIAVSGSNAYQVWFSLSAPVSVTHAMDFLALLGLRYLGPIAPRHIRMMPTADAAAPQHARHASMVPALQTETGHWSAFVAPELASMFADEPWLDLPPNPDAQANLLSRLVSIKPADFRRAQEQLSLADVSAPRATLSTSTPTADEADKIPGKGHAAAEVDTDPKRFLLWVMNDPTAELCLRIEAAKALLPYFEGVSHRCTGRPDPHHIQSPDLESNEHKGSR